MRDIAMTVSLSVWRATVHYADCVWYRRAHLPRPPVPARMKVGLCRFCRPQDEDVKRAVLEYELDFEWYPYSPAPGRALTGFVTMDLEAAENIAARRSMGWHKKLVKREGWS